MVRVLDAENKLKIERKKVKSLESKLKKYYDSILKLESEKTAANDQISYLQKCLINRKKIMNSSSLNYLN